MGYESKLYICKRSKIGDMVWNETLVAINMCVMDVNFRALFTNKLDGDFYGMDGAMSRFEQRGDKNGPELVDNYGDELKYTSATNVFDWCGKYIMENEGNTYWRIDVLWDMLFSLKRFAPVPFEELIVVHYGY